jgi:HD-like signal output (HDOD) protein
LADEKKAMVATAFSDTELIQVAQDLPSAPRLLVELGQLIRNPRTDSREIVALLRQDPALVARILRMANSAAYARAEPVGSLEEAVAGIGFREVHRLVGAVAATQLSDQHLPLYGVEGARLRENALFVAVIMEELAEECGEEPRSCYTVGLLRSIGKMALELLGQRDPSILSFAASGETALDAWEKETWGLTNCEVAEKILVHWRLPHETVIAIKHHYHPAGKHNPVIHLLTLATASAQDRCYGLPGEEAVIKITPENFTKGGLDERVFRQACERAQRTFQRLHAATAV